MREFFFVSRVVIDNKRKKGSTTLCVKHLPSELSADDREELLKLVGAVSVRVMPDDGKMKFCAFATFQSHEDAKYALSILHQKQILGRRLVVEYAADKHKNLVPHISDHPTCKPVIVKEKSSNLSEREVLKLGNEDFSRKLHGVAPALGLDYIPSPLLKYKYPLPTPTVIQNINHALVSVPKFYTQVLHLMNKMNLPAPFGPLTPVPPLTPDLCMNKGNAIEVGTDTDDLIPDVTSEEESEYESEEEGEKTTVEKILPQKRPPPKPKQKRKKKKIMDLIPLPCTVSSKPRTEPSEVFESQLITQKKINVKKIDQIAATDSSATNIEPAGGFGAFEASKEVKEIEVQKEPGDEIWDDSQFITIDEIRDKRISQREMKTLSIFRNFSPGEPTCRLYIKNLARQVEEKNLRYIFGRFIDRNSETDRNMFDIKLMKEGRMKGQAFVTLANEDQAIKAVKETNGYVLHTKPMVVQFARSAKAKDEDKKGKK